MKDCFKNILKQNERKINFMKFYCLICKYFVFQELKQFLIASVNMEKSRYQNFLNLQDLSQITKVEDRRCEEKSFTQHYYQQKLIKSVSEKKLVNRVITGPHTMRFDISSNQDKRVALAINLIYAKIQNNQTNKCSYAYFHICCLYSLAYLLTLAQNEKESYLFDLFQFHLKKSYAISKLKPEQIEVSFIMEVVVDALAYFKYKKRGEYYLQKLKDFLCKYKEQMMSFMPVYWAYFDLISNSTTIFHQKSPITEVYDKIKRLQIQLRQKYHNKEIE